MNEELTSAETKPSDYFKGRGAQINTANRFLKNEYVQEHLEMLDEELLTNSQTQYFYEHPKEIVNKIESPDLHGMYSMNPYQGCEHGCIYCYARNAHEYWGFSAGLDFERKIIVKENAPELLRKTFEKRTWKPAPIMLSGNTDCYQPAERKLKITRRMLEVLLEYRHPVSMITKNALILRDLDLLSELSKLNLVHVMITITTLNEDLRLKMEPRTVTGQGRLKVVEALSTAGIPVGVMTAPIIPGLNSEEVPHILEEAGKRGARTVGYTIVRLNGAIGDIFHDWLFKNFPDRAEKVWRHICECHGGQVNDSRWFTRTRGEGKIAESIRTLFKLSVKRFIKGDDFEFTLNNFRRVKKGQMELF